MKTRSLRLLTMAAVLIVFLVGAIFNSGLGALSSFGIGSIAAICPLGYFEAAFAGGDIMPHILISMLAVFAVTVFLGRAFCGWVCPVPLVRKLVTNKIDEGDNSLPNSCHQAHAAGAQIGRNTKSSSSGLVILGVTLGSSAIFGFPVFCLICPIGLVFASLIALIRLLHFNEPTFDLIVFPVLIIAEIILLKKWCRSFCPVGALLSLFSRFNRTLVPTVDRSLCLEEQNGVTCQRCRSACSFDIELKAGKGIGDISKCTKCRECAENCPVHAIHFPWR